MCGKCAGTATGSFFLFDQFPRYAASGSGDRVPPNVGLSRSCSAGSTDAGDRRHDDKDHPAGDTSIVGSLHHRRRWKPCRAKQVGRRESLPRRWMSVDLRRPTWRLEFVGMSRQKLDPFRSRRNPAGNRRSSPSKSLPPGPKQRGRRLTVRAIGGGDPPAHPARG